MPRGSGGDHEPAKPADEHGLRHRGPADPDAGLAPSRITTSVFDVAGQQVATIDTLTNRNT